MPIGYVINHKDFDGTNNHLTNLEYVTPKQNSQYSLRAGRFSKGSNRWSAKLTEQKVSDILTILKQGHISQNQLAKTYGVSQTTMNKIALRKLWKHV